jgi:MFS family permease
MKVRGSGTITSRSGAPDPSVRPGNVLNNPAAQWKFYDANQAPTRPTQLAFNPQDAQAKGEAGAKLLVKYAHYRNRAVWGQALVLFNVVGIPLSQGVYLEYYFNAALHSNSLSALAIIPALQITCILCMPIFVGWFYHWRGQRSGWRVMFVSAMVLALAAQLPLQWIKSYTITMLLQGPLLGVALGTLFTLSTLVLSSHYRFNLPLVSMQSGFTGFLGAVCYTFVARQGLQMHGPGHFAPAATAGIFAITLLAAHLLIHRVEENEFPPDIPKSHSDLKLPKSIGKIIKEQGTIWFILGYILVFFALFIFPIYITIILTQSPATNDPLTATFVPIITFASAAVSASISANPIFRKRIGLLDTFIASCIFAGAASLLPFFMPNLPVSLPCGAAYGIGLGAIISLHVKATTVFHGEKVVWHPDMPVRAAVMMVLAGCSAFAGLLASAFVIEYVASGVRIVASCAMGCMIVGGCLIAFARWRRCRKIWVAM